MQRVKYVYSGSATRKLTVSGRSSVIISGDSDSVLFDFTFPDVYKEYTKTIAWDCYCPTESGDIINPEYVMKDDSFLVPYEITSNNAGKQIAFVIRFSKEVEEDVGDTYECGCPRPSVTPTYIETSLPSAIYISRATKDDKCVLKFDALTQLIHEAVVEPYFDVDSEKDRLVFKYITLSGTPKSIILDVPYLDENGKIPSEFIDSASVNWGAIIGNIHDQSDLVKNSILTWDNTLKYDIGQMVMYRGKIYVSRINANYDNIPSSSPLQWNVIDSQPTKNSYTEIIGDGVSREITVKHDLGRKDVFVAIRKIEDDSFIQTGIIATSENEVKFIFTTAPAKDSLSVVISTGDNSTTDAYTQVIGDGTHKTYLVAHNMNTKDVYTSIRSNLDDSHVDAFVEAVSENLVQITFDTPPAIDEYAVTISSGMGGATSRWVGVQWVTSEQKTEWQISLDQFAERPDRMLSVQTFDSNGTLVEGAIEQSASSVSIKFTNPIAGTAVIV